MSESSSPVQTPTDSASPPAEVLPCTAWVRGGAGPHADPPQVTRFDPHAAQLPGVLDTLRRLAQLLSDAESALRPRAPFSLSHHDRT